MDTSSQNAILFGGPRDGEQFPVGDAAVADLKIDGFIHRYIRTTQTREVDDRTLTVYNYDGELDPEGAESGVETRGDGRGAE